MKLHQINLENLNSLYGEHKLDLEGALGDPPLFLIVGPTGSGKSTLMDAVSLALFGVTPRLSGERGQDHREAHHIMSHGTGSCYAEVIFSKLEGGQRARYRARWSCRRAHGRAKGKPQRPQRGLDRLDPETGEWVILCAHDLKKTYGPHFDEVLEGLTVHDFRRSVLLAQGAFAAFIDASEDERAAILERLTETGEYKRLGQRAALWRRQAEQQLQALETQRDKLALLSKPEVEARRAEVEALGEALASATSRVAALRGRATWLREAVVAEEALAAAEAAAAEAEAALRAEAPELARLGQIGALTVQAEARRLRRERAEAEAEAPGRAEAVIEAKGRLSQSADDLAAAEHAYGQAVARAEADQARVAAAAAALERTRLAREERDAAISGVVTAEAQVTAATEALAVAAVEVEAAAASCAAHAPKAEALPRWAALRAFAPSLEAEMSARRAAEAQVKRAEAGQAEELARLGGCARALKEATRKRDRAARALGPLEAELGAATAALEALLEGQEIEARRAALRAAAQVARAEGRAVEAIAVALTALEGAEARRAAAQAQAQAASEARAEAEAALKREAAAVEAATEAAAEATRRLREVEIIEALSAYRAALQDHAPCPLCGSEIHPLLDALRAEDQGRAAVTARLAEAKRAATATLEAASAAQRGAATRLATLEGRHSATAAALSEASEAAKAAKARVTACLGDSSAVARDVEARRAAAEAAEAAASMALEAIEAAEGEVRRAAARHANAKQAYEAQAQACAIEVERHQGAQDRAATCEQRLIEDISALRGVSGRLNDKLNEVHAPLAEDLAARISAVRALVDDLDQLEARTLSLEAAHQAALSVHQARAEALTRAVEAAAAAKAAAESREAALRAAEAAQPIDEAEAKALKAGAAAQLKAAMADLKAAERAHREALIALRAAEASADGLDQRLGALTLKAAEVEGRLRSALDALGLESEVALGPPLDAAQVAALEATRGRLERRLAVCQAQVEGARAARAAHLDRVEARLEGAEAEALEAEAARVEAALEGQRRRRLLLEGELERQREGEATHAHLIEALEEATQRKSLRDRLHSLIGVSEGDHFKRFAQILNLRELIAKANAHLERLSPRYQLAPALGDDGWPKLAFVVNDAHQAHDARPLTTLSGGETFLVSLALALSLADFRHLKMPISTLLLDEGFGTLDPETLSMAMQALEKLQASGAQIGIISHVSALIERIGARVFVEKIGAGRSRIKTNLDGVEG